MLIKMLSTRRVWEFDLCKRLEKGKVYDLGHTTAAYVLRNGWAFNAEPDNDRAEVIRRFLAQSTRGSAPVNPATTNGYEDL